MSCKQITNVASKAPFTKLLTHNQQPLWAFGYFERFRHQVSRFPTHKTTSVNATYYLLTLPLQSSGLATRNSSSYDIGASPWRLLHCGTPRLLTRVEFDEILYSREPELHLSMAQQPRDPPQPRDDIVAPTTAYT